MHFLFSFFFLPLETWEFGSFLVHFLQIQLILKFSKPLIWVEFLKLLLYKGGDDIEFFLPVVLLKVGDGDVEWKAWQWRCWMDRSVLAYFLFIVHYLPRGMVSFLLLLDFLIHCATSLHLKVSLIFETFLPPKLKKVLITYLIVIISIFLTLIDNFLWHSISKP